MSAPFPADRADASARIRKAAIALFKTRGYHGTPVRALARIVRIEAASLYYHFPSKQEILLDMFDRTMDDLIAGLAQATGGVAGTEDRLRAAVRFHVLFHTDRRDEAFVSHSELRSLTAANLRRIIDKRDRYEAMFRALLADGAAAGLFHIGDLRLATIAILTMCSCVADWFTPGGRLDADFVADRYEEMVLALVGRPSGHRGRPVSPPRGGRASRAPARPRTARPSPTARAHRPRSTT